jgi:hypothetical protein
MSCVVKSFESVDKETRAVNYRTAWKILNKKRKELIVSFYLFNDIMNEVCAGRELCGVKDVGFDKGFGFGEGQRAY